ncbi:MAG: hydroxysqualene dehydroxylase HpnE, partial [Elusimicrobia bacterium]|nr:hydroxysqualene dehydroxylase HpnE [Elusimicrobiota bacterium]
GRRVVLLEKKPHLGGRAYSFTDQETGDVVDNGQHLFMGCYGQTRAFLSEIGTSERLNLAPGLRLDFADADGRRDALSCPAWLGAPWHLAAGVLRLRGLSLRDKAALVRLDASMRSLRRLNAMPAELDRMTARQWLDGLGQTRRLQSRLLDPVALGALNEDPAVAAATGLAQVLRHAFYRDAEGSRLGLAAVGLSDLYAGSARSFIESRGGEIRLSCKVRGVSRGRVVCEGGEVIEAGTIVSTLPPWSLRCLELPPELEGAWRTLEAAPIVSISLWLDRPVMTEPLLGLLGAEIQWIFNKTRLLSSGGSGQCLALVISGARRWLASSPRSLLELARADLGRCLPAFKKATIRRWLVIKEPFATLSPVPGSDAKRPAAVSAVSGFLFAGDWTQTGLPATIESAVLSGRRAARLILEGKQHA